MKKVPLALPALLLLLSACGGSAAAPPSSGSAAGAPASVPASKLAPVSGATSAGKQLTIVKVGELGLNMSNAGIYIADKQGYFKEQGIQLEETNFDDSLKMVPLLSQNELDVAAGGPGAALYNALARDTGIKIVADKGNLAPGAQWAGIVIRKDLWDAGKHSLTDLKGESIALVAPAASQQIQLEQYIEPKLGLKADDLKEVTIPFPQMAAALKNKAVAAAMPIEPLMTKAILNPGLAVLAFTADQYYPNGQASMLMFGSRLDQNTNLANRFTLAYLKGIRDYVDAFKKGKNKAKIVQLLVDKKVLANAEEADQLRYTGLNPNGYVNAQGLKSDQEWLAQRGYVKQQVDLDKAIDNRFVEYAVEVLGTYK